MRRYGIAALFHSALLKDETLQCEERKSAASTHQEQQNAGKRHANVSLRK